MFRRYVAPSPTNYVPPAGQTWPFAGYGYINNDPDGFDQAPVDPTPSALNNVGTMFQAFQGEASTAVANRPHGALAINIDALDDLLHRPLARTAYRVNMVAPAAGYLSVTAGFIWTGNAADGDPDDFVKVMDRVGADSVFVADGLILRRACVDIMQDAVSILGTGFVEATPALPISFHFNEVLPLGAQVRLYYSVRDSIATEDVGASVRHKLNPSVYPAVVQQAVATCGKLSTGNTWDGTQTHTTITADGSELGWTLVEVTRQLSDVWVGVVVCRRVYKNGTRWLMTTNAVRGAATWSADDVTKPASMTEWNIYGEQRFTKIDTSAPWAAWDDNAAPVGRAYKYATISGGADTRMGDTTWHKIVKIGVAELEVTIPSAASGGLIEVMGQVSLSNATAETEGVSIKAQVGVPTGGGSWTWYDVDGSLQHVPQTATPLGVTVMGVYELPAIPGHYTDLLVRLVCYADHGSIAFSPAADHFLRATLYRISAEGSW